jgi:release factor glutamine methyltransferase
LGGGRITIATLVVRIRRRLEAAGIPPGEADLDARLLAQHALGWDSARFLMDREEEAPGPFEAQLEALASRRANREPLAYITGRKEFWGLDFIVSNAVLIPRPETELLVEAALTLCTGEAASIADACTGSGCIAVALARERSTWRLVATDSSREALTVARRNAALHGVTGQIEFLQTDVLAEAPGPFDLIVSNPPYVTLEQQATLQPEILMFEPPDAVFAGEDGLSVIRKLIDQAVIRLNPGGLLMFEFGIHQEAAVRELISVHDGLTMIDLKRDLQGIPRTAVARMAEGKARAV